MAATKPRTRDELIVAEIDDELVVYDPATDALHHLNPAASLVFGLCDGTATMKETAADMARLAGLDPVEVEKEVRSLVRGFRKSDLLVRKPAPAAQQEHDGHAHDGHEHEHEHDGRALVRVHVPKSQ
jgi:hypothetical protein